LIGYDHPLALEPVSLYWFGQPLIFQEQMSVSREGANSSVMTACWRFFLNTQKKRYSPVFVIPIRRKRRGIGIIS
jgi:hypothetical protein